jgi:hypothetical protein
MRDTLVQARRQIEKSLWLVLREAAAIEPVEGKLMALLQGNVNIKKFLSELRKALKSSAYQKNRQDETHPLVRFLHRLCLASYREPELVGAYRIIGDTLAQKKTIDKKTLLGAVHDAGFTVNDRTVRYFLSHPKKIFQAYLSTRWGNMLFPFVSYDPKFAFGNIPGKFFDINPSVRVIYTPTPTIGDKILIEARALLDALKCRNEGWIYVNLQNIACPDEGPRSKNIMKLGDEYPNTFFGITLAQDAGIYSGGEDFLKILTDPVNFTLNSPHGYYFPASRLTEQKEWTDKLIEIHDLAIILAKKRADPQDFKTVFCELLTLGIIKYYVSRVKKRVLLSISCKESIDRGGKMNALLYWAENKENEENFKVVFSCLHARALYVRGRQIRKRRLHEAAALLYSVSHKEIQDFFTKVCT